MSTFGEQIREYRRRRGLTQRDLYDAIAADFRYNVAGLSKLEHGRIDPRTLAPEEVEAIADALGLSTSERRALEGLHAQEWVPPDPPDPSFLTVCRVESPEEEQRVWQRALDEWNAMSRSAV